MTRPLFSVCIPAYNRSHHLAALLDSIFAQEFGSFEVVICEDLSPERDEIAKVANEYQGLHGDRLRYVENPVNLGYDANIRRLVELSEGRFCFFMGNDDLLCPGSLAHVADLLERHPDVGFILKSYAWFHGNEKHVDQEVRYFTDETFLPSGPDAITVCFRRSGVISGYIVDRDHAQRAATDRFDGTLYYQLHLTAQVLVDRAAMCTPRVLVWCRVGEPPDFGHSVSEKGRFVPGTYTPEARLRMVGGAISIVQFLKESRHVDVVDRVLRDYANYFYPYIKDQLGLSLRAYIKLYRSFAAMGFSRFPMFHVYIVLGYVLGEKRFDATTRYLRRLLGRSPQFQIARTG